MMKRLANVLTLVICAALIFITVLQGVRPAAHDISVGDTCPVDIYATRDVVDKITTEKQKNEAEASVPDQYDFDNSITLRSDRDLANLFIEIAKSRAGEPSDFVSDYCLTLGDVAYNNFRETVTNVQQDIMNKGVVSKDEALSDAREQLRGRLYDETAALAGIEILTETIAVNKDFSEDKTADEVLRARENVPSVTYKLNQVIVRRGDIITEAQFGVLSDLGLVRGREDTKIAQIAGALLLTLICFAIASVYIRQSKKAFPPRTHMIAAIVCAVTILMLFVNAYDIINIYMIPISAGCILIAVLLEVRFALLINALVSVIASIVLGADAYYTASMIAVGCIGVFLFTNIEMRKGLVFASLAFCGVTAFVFFVTGILEGLEIIVSLNRVFYGLLNGFITSVIVMGTLPFWESAFDITTPFRLTELTNPNQPLLKRLLLEAPGTYHHSLMVGNLAEAACEVIGGNYLLARAGAYYHDVGKLTNPEMFAENQYGENPHDSMAPEKSAQIIIAHVKDGADLAETYKLPKAIKSVIASHHGNTSAAYFFHKAKQADENADITAYRYRGPKPSSKEEAIVMLADSVEAAVRSLDDKSEASIHKMIIKIVSGKLDDGQLSSSPLTLAEINLISDAFVKVFGGYFHSRVKYPDKE